LRATGALTDKEFRKLKAKVIGKISDDSRFERRPAARRSNWTLMASSVCLIAALSCLWFLFTSEEYAAALFRANLEGMLRRSWAALFDVGNVNAEARKNEGVVRDETEDTVASPTRTSNSEVHFKVWTAVESRQCPSGICGGVPGTYSTVTSNKLYIQLME
jgi:hypothetical protein